MGGPRAATKVLVAALLHAAHVAPWLQVAVAPAAAASLSASGSESLMEGKLMDQPHRFYPRGKEYFTFGDVTVVHHRSLNKHGDRTPRPAGVPPFQPMLSSPSGAPDALPFLFVHQPKSAGTSIRKVLVRNAVNGTTLDHGILPVGDPCIPDALPCPTGSSPLHTVAGHYRYMHAREALVQRNRLPPDTPVPCLTYIRKPVERLTSFYYWMLHDRPTQVNPGNKTHVALQVAAPREAVDALIHSSFETRHFFHMPFLALFGTLTPRQFIQLVRHPVQSTTSTEIREMLADAATVARRNLQSCVVANTDDMGASSELIAHFLPWLSDALRADAVPSTNTRSEHRHPKVVLADGTPAPESLLAEPLPPDTRRAVEQWYSADIDVYNFALDLHHRQLQYVRGQRGGTTAQ